MNPTTNALCICQILNCRCGQRAIRGAGCSAQRQFARIPSEVAGRCGRREHDVPGQLGVHDGVQAAVPRAQEEHVRGTVHIAHIRVHYRPLLSIAQRTAPQVNPTVDFEKVYGRSQMQPPQYSSLSEYTDRYTWPQVKAFKLPFVRA